MKKHTTIIMIGLVILSLILFWLSTLIPWAGLGNFIGFVALGVLLVSGGWLFLTKTKDGQRIKKELLDPVLKPQGTETQDWDANSGKVRTGNFSGTKNKANGGGSKEDKDRHRFLLIGIIFFAILFGAGIVFTLSDEELLSSTPGEGISELVAGLVSGDETQIAEGGRLIWIQVRSILLPLLFLLVMIAVWFMIYHIYRKGHRNQFIKEDQSDGFWKS